MDEFMIVQAVLNYSKTIEPKQKCSTPKRTCLSYISEAVFLCLFFNTHFVLFIKTIPLWFSNTTTIAFKSHNKVSSPCLNNTLYFKIYVRTAQYINAVTRPQCFC